MTGPTLPAGQSSLEESIAAVELDPRRWLALLNTLYAGAVAGYVSEHLTNPANAEKVTGLAFVHGYHVSFFWGAVLLFLGLLVVVFFINAKKEDVPTEPGMGGG